MTSNNFATNQQAVADSNHIIEGLDERQLDEYYAEKIGSLGYPALTFDFIFNTFFQYKKRVKKLDGGCFYTFQDICGDDYCDQLTEKEKIHSHDCMMFLIEYANLPIFCRGYLANHEFVYDLV